MLTEAIFSFDDRLELKWIGEAFARYLSDPKEWVSREGKRHRMDDIVDQITRGPMRFGSCLGTHRVYSLVMLLRINDSFTSYLTKQCSLSRSTWTG